MNILRGIIGIIFLLGIAYLFSNNKKKINWKLVVNGLILQIIFAVLIIKGDSLGNFFAPLAWPKQAFNSIGYLFVVLLHFTSEGAQFIFGSLALSPGTENSMGYFFAFQVLPTIIFFACLMSVLYYLGIMQRIVQAMAWIMAKFMGTSGAESLSCAANIFVGQTEAPLMVKPFIKDLTNSEILTIMVGGMATIAGGVMASYVQMLSQTFAATNNIPLNEAKILFATHLLGASCMAAPAGLLISKILYPETLVPKTKGKVKVELEKNSSNLIEAAAAGTSDGLNLALNVGAMLIAFIALIALFNYLLGWVGDITGLNAVIKAAYHQEFSIQFIFGFFLQYLAFIIGVPWESAMHFGSLLGTKVALNEFVAYSDMSNLIALKKLVDEKTILMATYALCGFANFSSVAILVGGLTPLAPERRSDFASLGLKAVLGGSLATLMTATLAGILF